MLNQSGLVFQTRVPSKWILAGEHAVLTGQPALAIPSDSRKLKFKFRFEPESSGFRCQPPEAETIVRELVKLLGEKLPRGTLILENEIPVGAGFGSSASLCVAVCQWLFPDLQHDPEKLRVRATELEHFFHGKSSGMDVAVVALGTPIWFERSKSPVALTMPSMPRFTFHDTGLRASTRACIEKVEAFRKAQPAEAKKWDLQMGDAARLARKALETKDLKGLAAAMESAQACFEAWNLIPLGVKEQVTLLKSQGALAVKITGSGDGGFLVALWPNSD